MNYTWPTSTSCSNCKSIFCCTDSNITCPASQQRPRVETPFWVTFVFGNVSCCNGCKGKIACDPNKKALPPPDDIVLQHKEYVVYQNSRTGYLYEQSKDVCNVYYHPWKTYSIPFHRRLSSNTPYQDKAWLRYFRSFRLSMSLSFKPSLVYSSREPIIQIRSLYSYTCQFLIYWTSRMKILFIWVSNFVHVNTGIGEGR